jgi:hypothetical protein
VAVFIDVISSRAYDPTWLMLATLYNLGTEHINHKNQPLQTHFKNGKLMDN